MLGSYFLSWTTVTRKHCARSLEVCTAEKRKFLRLQSSRRLSWDAVVLECDPSSAGILAYLTHLGLCPCQQPEEAEHWANLSSFLRLPVS